MGWLTCCACCALWWCVAAWMAPEVMRNNYGFPADVYSFGVVLYELVTCRVPWAGSEYTFTHQIMRAVFRGERPDLHEADVRHAPESFVTLMRQCWATDPKERPTFEDAVVVLRGMLNGGHKDK